jgi:cell shape-determining protein MreD
MRSRLLRFFNFPLLVLVLLIGLAIQSALFRSHPIRYFQPDFALLFVIWVAFRRSFTEGGIFTLVVGSIVESHSSAPQGFFMICYMVIYLGIRAFVTFFLLSQWASLSLVAIGSSLFFKATEWILLAPMGAAERQSFHLLIQTLPSALMAGVCALFVFPLLSSFDHRTFKSDREQSFLDDELSTEEGY